VKLRFFLAAFVLFFGASAVAQSVDVFYMAQAQAPAVAGQKVQRTRQAGQQDVIAIAPAPFIGPWWRNSDIANELHLTDQQKKEIDQSFYQYRLQLIDATAATEKLDTQLDALMNADYLEEAKINEVLDQLVQARGQLSKIYAGMLISIRKVLLPEQWKSLQELQAKKGVMPMMLPDKAITFGMGMPPAAGGVIFKRRLQPPPGAPAPPPPPQP
jgi:Spy/CpxP family protein refolding chaperone